MQCLEIRLEIIAACFARFENKDRNALMILKKHSGNCQSVPAIIPFATKNLENPVLPASFIHPVKTLSCGTFH